MRKLYGGQRIGQSRQELVLTVFLSFFLHAAVIIIALFISSAIGWKTYIPPSYAVNLVSLPTEKMEAPDKEKAVIPQPEPVKEKRRAPEKKQPAVQKTVPNKDAIPELDQKKTKKPTKVEEQPAVEQQQQQTKPAQAGQGGGVAVSTITGDFQYQPSYLEWVRNKIARNWNPPPGVQGAKSKVRFTIDRRGAVSDVRIVESSGNQFFDQASIRAIWQSNPFPHMPDDFYKSSADFAVDLMEKN
jgi:TonB family protein